MRYVQIRAFHFVALSGGFSRAAEALFLTQPAISDQVKKLEAEYDVLLFNRRIKQVELTEPGRKLFEITKRLFEIEDQALDFLSENKAFTVGTLRIKADSAHHILGTIAKFREKFPQIKIEIKTGNSHDVIQDLLSYDADIGVLGAIPQNPNIEVITLGKSPIIAFTSKSNPIAKHSSLSIRQLAEMPLVLREPRSKTRQKLEAAAAEEGLVLKPVIEAEGREAVQEIVASGTGIGFVSQKEFSLKDQLVPIHIKGPKIEMEEYVINLRERNGGKLIRTFIAMVHDTVSAGETT
ncbi:LysR substrate-binding domain-containing protein [Alphaproteobacteria bacterium]|nr:LysR substrate-binding domain-containing protein [Alphaproteobacteria bacterium]